MDKVQKLRLLKTLERSCERSQTLLLYNLGNVEGSDDCELFVSGQHPHKTRQINILVPYSIHWTLADRIVPTASPCKSWQVANQRTSKLLLETILSI